MAQDPYSSLGEGFSQGIGNVAQIASLRAKKQESEREQKKMQFDELRKNLQTYSEVLKSDVPQQLRQAAANGILGMYKKHGSDMGLDPSQLPEKVSFDDTTAEMFSNKILSMNKLYEKGIIGKNDYRVGMFNLAQDYRNATGKENADIMKTADEVAQPDRKIIDAVIGQNRVKLQETAPGSGQFEPMIVGGKPVSGPATQRVEMVKPPSESERTKMADIRSDQDMNQLFKDVVTKNPKWVGFGKDAWSKVSGTLNTMPQDQQEFYAAMRLNKLKKTKFYLGTAQSKQEAKNALAAIPDISMGSKQLLGAIEADRKNTERMLDRTMEVLQNSGLKVPQGAPPEVVAELYNHAKASGKLKTEKKKVATEGASGRPSLAVIFADSEE